MIENSSWLCTWVVAQLWSGQSWRVYRPCLLRCSWPHHPGRTGKGSQLRMQKEWRKRCFFLLFQFPVAVRGWLGLYCFRNCRKGLMKTVKISEKWEFPAKVGSPRSLSIVLGQERRTVRLPALTSWKCSTTSYKQECSRIPSLEQLRDQAVDWKCLLLTVPLLTSHRNPNKGALLYCLLKWDTTLWMGRLISRAETDSG